MSDFLDLGIVRDLVDNGTSDDYYTPPFIFEALGIAFDIDVCAPPQGVPWIPADRSIDIIEDGLATDWYGRVWINPPYSNPGPWLKKLAKHGNGFALVPASKSQWFIDLWDQATGITILPPNLKFVRASGESAPIFMPCVLVAYGIDNAKFLVDSGLGKVR
jgi:hypothetical protein